MQMRTVLSFTPEEERKVMDAYVMYLKEGGKLSKNRWMKEMIMESIE